MRRHLTYANITATVALFVALGGSAFAISNIGSKDIRNNAVRSADLRNGRAVGGRDVIRNALGAPAINEKSLDASRFAKLGGSQQVDCDPNSPTDFKDCAKASIRLAKSARVLIVASGDEETVVAPASAVCEVRVDDEPASIQATPGELSDNTSAGATNGFARTFVTPDPLPPGRHEVALACAELAGGDVKIDVPTIAALAINEP